MSLIHWQPLRELDTLRQQMNRLFDELIHSTSTSNLLPKNINTWAPAIELKETDTDIIVKAQVPGMDAKDLDVQVSQDAVSIAGEHQEEKRSEAQGFFRSEFRYGQFQRIVPLPVNVKHQQVKAEFKDGILTLILPKAEVSDRNAVKVDLTMAEKARGAMAQQRQQEEHLQQTMHTRAAEELETPTHTDVPEEARVAMTSQRMHDEHLEETMHTRAATEVGASTFGGGIQN
ncbi:MAG: Hsp20/alpha crystallin family protein [Heteroscytonema crispum UTEX LB 1556]